MSSPNIALLEGVGGTLPQLNLERVPHRLAGATSHPQRRDHPLTLLRCCSPTMGALEGRAGAAKSSRCTLSSVPILARNLPCTPSTSPHRRLVGWVGMSRALNPRAQLLIWLVLVWASRLDEADVPAPLQGQRRLSREQAQPSPRKQA